MMIYMKICGKCANEQKLSVLERLELSKSRLPGIQYQCDFCKVFHSLDDAKKPVEFQIDKERVKRVLVKNNIQNYERRYGRLSL